MYDPIRALRKMCGSVESCDRCDGNIQSALNLWVKLIVLYNIKEMGSVLHVVRDLM